MAERYLVVVEHNLVCSIEPVGDGGPDEAFKTPLDAATRLATNNRMNGCIDGRYCLEGTRHVRTFAELCLEFTRALADRRLADIARLPAGSPAYRADESDAG